MTEAKMLKQTVEKLLQEKLKASEYSRAEQRAKRKLAQIIEREGNENGARTTLDYLARLIAEFIQAERMTAFGFAVQKLQMEIKKEMPAAEAAGQI